MEIIEHATTWVKGEVLQGKIGLSAAILMAIAFLYFANFQQSFYKGMIIPFIILQLVLLGYSSYQLIIRPKHIAKLEQIQAQNPQSALEMELTKSQKDDEIFSKIRIVWASLLLLSLLGAFLFNNSFYKGMSVGFVIFFIVAYLFDTFLHLRLKTYLTALFQIQ